MGKSKSEIFREAHGKAKYAAICEAFGGQPRSSYRSRFVAALKSILYYVRAAKQKAAHEIAMAAHAARVAEINRQYLADQIKWLASISDETLSSVLLNAAAAENNISYATPFERKSEIREELRLAKEETARRQLVKVAA